MTFLSFIISQWNYKSFGISDKKKSMLIYYFDV